VDENALLCAREYAWRAANILTECMRQPMGFRDCRDVDRGVQGFSKVNEIKLSFENEKFVQLKARPEEAVRTVPVRLKVVSS
jgi:hypothetical protein